jgi:hypothetical protein
MNMQEVLRRTNRLVSIDTNESHIKWRFEVLKKVFSLRSVPDLWESKIWSWVPRESELKMTVLAKASNNVPDQSKTGFCFLRAALSTNLNSFYLYYCLIGRRDTTSSEKAIIILLSLLWWHTRRQESDLISLHLFVHNKEITLKVAFYLEAISRSLIRQYYKYS